MAENPRVEELRRKLDREPGSRMFAQLAEELRKEGDFAEAIRVSRAGLAQHPSYPSARMTLGRALLDSGDLPAARGEFEAVLRGAPDNILASRFLAECLESMGDLGSALLQYRAALQMAPGDRQLEVRIRALDQKLTPPRRSNEAIPAVPGPGPSPPRAAPPAEAAATAAALPPGFEPGAPTILMSAGARERRPEPAAPAPPVPATARSAPPAPPPAPRRPPQVAPVVPAAPRALEESFELEAPFAGSRLHAAEAAPRRELAFDDRLDETLDGTLETTLEDAPTTPKLSVTPGAPAREVEEGVGGGTRPVPLVPRSALEPPPAPSAAAPASPPPAPAAPPPPRSEPVPAAAEPVRVAEAGEPPPLASSTLAELYLRQGFVDRAIEVYQQLLQREPGNERARARMEDLSALLAASSRGVVSGPPPAAPPDERAASRSDLERTIARLEQLLATVRRHAPAGGAG